MYALFVLLPAGLRPDELLGAAALPGCAVRTYGPADDARHLHSLVRAARDPLATRWRRGMAVAIGAGAALGLLTNGVLAAAFGMFGGLVEIALPLGAGVGAFLGGFTAAMTGTERPNPALRPLLAQVQPGQVLLQVVATAPAARPALDVLRSRAESRGLTPIVLRP